MLQQKLLGVWESRLGNGAFRERPKEGAQGGVCAGTVLLVHRRIPTPVESGAIYCISSQEPLQPDPAERTAGPDAAGRGTGADPRIGRRPVPGREEAARVTAVRP